MAWPSHALTSEGFKEYTDPVTNLREGALKKAGWEGLDDWRGMGKSSGITLWNIKNNPVWESAAKATGMDWKVLTESFPDQAAYNARASSAAEWWMKQPENYKDAWTETIPGTYRKGGTGPKYVNHPEFIAHNVQKWGLDSREGERSTTFISNMDTMNDWIKRTVKGIDNIYPDAPIIEAGPTHDQYGLPKGEDPWEFYGLDKLPRILPEALDVNYEYNLMDAKPSSATYRTPKGYPAIDLDAVETAELGESFTDYVDAYDFAQEVGVWDEDLGTHYTGKGLEDLNFIFDNDEEALADVRIFGQMDYNQLVEQGLGKEEIRQLIFARTERGQKLIMGPAMAKLFDMYTYDPRWWGQEADTLGEKGVRLLKLQGLDDAGIMNRYAKGKHESKIGQWVKDTYGIRVWPDTGMYDYYYNDPGGKKAFGMKDYNQLINQGMDPARVKQIAKEFIAAGGIIGGDAAIAMELRGFTAATEVLSKKGHLGGQVLDEYRSAGWSDDQLRDLADRPEVLKIGPDAATQLWGWQDRGEIGGFGMKEINQTWPRGSTPDKNILGKIAAGVARAIGPNAVDYIWGDELYDSHMPPPAGAEDNALTFGMDAINYLVTHPTNPVTSREGLIAIARGAPFIGVQAAKELGIDARPAPASTRPAPEYDIPNADGTQGGFGQQEVQWMINSGWSKDQMRSTTQNFNAVGPEAAKYLWGESIYLTMSAPIDAVDPGATTFSKDTIKYLDQVDPAINDNSIAAIARGIADYVGQEALEWFADKGIDVGKGPAPKLENFDHNNPPPPITPSIPTPSIITDSPTTTTTPTPITPTTITPSGPTPYVEQGNLDHFEQSDLDWLQKNKYSDEDIRAIAKGQKEIGSAAAQWVYDFEVRKEGGKKVFGIQDYNKLINAGANELTIENVARNTDVIGPEVAKDIYNFQYRKSNGRTEFGNQDWNKLKSAGASDETIKGMAHAAQLVGPDVAKRVYNFNYRANGGKTEFGNQDWNKLKSAGASDETIKGLARGAAVVGPDVAKRVYNFSYRAGGEFGNQDWNKLKSAGASDETIKGIARGATVVGPEIAKRVYNFSYRGGGEFGNNDYDKLKRAGANDATIKQLAANANVIGGAIASKFWGYTDPGNAKGWFGGDDYNQLKRNGASEHVMRAIIRGMGLQLGNNYKWLG